MQPRDVGPSKPPCTSLPGAKALSVMATPTPPMFRSLSKELKCALPKLAPSTALCARPTESASARSRRSARLDRQAESVPRSEEMPRSLPTVMAMVAVQSAITSAKSFASINSIANLVKAYADWISRGAKGIARCHAGASRDFRRPFGRLGRERPQCPTLPAQQLSRPERRCSVRRQIAGLHAADRCAADQIPDGLFLVRVQRVQFRRQAQKAVLHSGFSHPGTRSIFRPCHFQPPLLQPQSPVEVQLVPARLWLRCRTAGSR